MRAMPDWADHVTVLQAVGKRLVKLIPLVGEPLAYDSPYLFDGYAIAVAGLDDIRALLDRLLERSDCFVVRGEMIGGTRVMEMLRRVHPNKKTGEAPTLRDVPRRWMALDHDSVPIPDDCSPTDLLGCADAVIDRLPRAFWRAACIVQATASHGIKPGARIRTWHWCDRPIGGAEAKRWLGKLTDGSVLNTCQPIYTGRPLFGPGRVEHLRERITYWPGEDWLHCPSAEELAPPPRQPPAYVAPAHVAGSARSQLYVDGALDKARERIANAELRHPAILSEACSLARFLHAGLLTRSALQNALWAGAQAAGKDDQAEIERMVDFGLDHPDTTAIPEDLRNG